MSISFVISTNAAKRNKTEIEIASIKKSLSHIGCKGQIIVSGSTEKFKDIPGIELAECEADANNGMLAKIRNIGAEKATEDIIVFVDDDFLFPPTWVTRMLEYDSANDWSVMTCKVLLPDEGRFWDRAIIKPHHLVPYSHPPTDPNLYITGGFWVMKRSVYENNKWDDSIKIYGTNHGSKENEDVNLSRRCHEKNIPLDFDRYNTVWHWDYNYKQNGKVVSRYNGDMQPSEKFKKDLKNAKP